MAVVIGALALELVGLGAFAETALITIGATTITASAVVGYGLVTAATLGLSLLAARKAATPANLGATTRTAEAGHQPLRQAEPERIVGFGTNRIAGSYMLFESQNGNSYDVMDIHHGRIEAIRGYYLDDGVVEIDGSGFVQVQGDGSYGGNNIKIETRLGAATETAYASMVTALPTLWTNAHRGDNQASAALTCLGVSIDDFTVIYPHGLPLLSLVADCAPVFDPRDGPQDFDDSLTWLSTHNPVLQLIDKLTDADRGMGLDRDTLIVPALTALMAEADLCDAQVDKADGSTEARYRSDGTFSLAGDDADTLAAILDTCDGWMAEAGDGTLALKVGVYRVPSFIIEARDIKGAQLKFGVADEDLVNEVAFDYTEPQLDYKTTPGASWQDTDSIARLGKKRSQKFALPWVQQHAQGRRLSKRRIRRLNARLSGTITTSLYGLVGMGERWIAVKAPQLNAALTDIVIEVLGLTVDLKAQTVAFQFVAINPNAIDAWDAATEEGSPPTIPSKLVVPPPPVPQNISATAIVGHAVFDVFLDDPGRSDLTFQARWRIGAGAWTEGPARQIAGSSYLVTGGAPPAGRVRFAGATGVTSGMVEIQARAYGPASLPSAWSASVTIAI